MKMDQLDINPRIINAIRKAKLTDFAKIVCMSASDIERRTGLSTNDVRIFQKSVANSLIKIPFVSALQMKEGDCPPSLKVTKLTTGCALLDRFLRGGILCRGITEICGESASGKTQWCLQLCLTAQLPPHLGGLAAGAVYICTEDVFPNKRLMQMVTHARQKYSLLKLNWTDNIFVEHTAEIEDLSFCINQKLPLLLSQGKVKLVVVDSIAALFRCEYEYKNMRQRAKQLVSFGAKLHSLSNEYGCAVICVNQVTAAMSGSTGQSRSDIQPSLGISWANMVTTRLMLSRTQRCISIPSAGSCSHLLRHVDIMFAPHLPNTAAPYIVTAQGVQGVT